MIRLTACVTFITIVAAATALAQPDAGFTYQGLLLENGEPLDGLVDVEATLWDDPEAGSQIGGAIPLQDVSVEQGRLLLQLNFGAEAFDNSMRWLQVAVDGVPLLPRQPVTRTPYALQTRGIFVDDAEHASIGGSTNRAILNVEGDDQPFTGQLAIVNPNATSDSDTADAYITGYASEFLDGEDAEGRLWYLGNALSGDRNVYFVNQLPATLGFGTAGRTNDLVIDAFGNASVAGDIVADRIFLESALDGPVSIANDANGGTIYMDSANNSSAVALQSTAHLHGAVSVSDAAGTSKAVLGADSDGITTVGVGPGGLYTAYFRLNGFDGHMVADVKNFIVPNPDDPYTNIAYACIEGPEAAMYVRGTGRVADGRATIELPPHFSALAADDGITVILTPLSADTHGLAAVGKSTERIEVRELAGGTGTFEFDWEVKAVRRAHQDYQVYRPWNTALMPGTTEQEAWKARQERIRARNRRIAENESETVASSQPQHHP